jgi:hypothetical protein
VNLDVPGMVQCEHVYQIAICSIYHSDEDCKQKTAPCHHKAGQGRAPFVAEDISEGHPEKDHNVTNTAQSDKGAKAQSFFCSVPLCLKNLFF